MKDNKEFLIEIQELKSEIESLNKNIDKLTEKLALSNIEKSGLEQIAFHDQLTGSFNRTYLDTVLKMQYENVNCFVGFIDLNNLKIANDTYGHDYGDILIINICKKISDFGITVRLGGDEFLFIIDKKEERKVKKLLKLAESDNEFALGMVEKTEKVSFSTAMKCADFLMYKDKLRIKEGKPISKSFYPPKLDDKFCCSGEIPLHILMINSLK